MPYDSDFDFDFDGLGVQSIDNSKNFDYKQNFLKSLKNLKEEQIHMMVLITLGLSQEQVVTNIQKRTM